ncbi:glycogen/starch synthase [Anaerolineales bacterium HSG24]|nr:glycogen/starch synthase [Anaerolineales bacterium HSG24]
MPKNSKKPMEKQLIWQDETEQPRSKFRVAMIAWEIGRADSGFGVKIGSLGNILSELPAELIKTARQQNLELEIEILSPCFGHYDRNRLTKLDDLLPTMVDGNRYEFEIYKHIFVDGQKATYFWNHEQLHWTNATNIYPTDTQKGLELFASVNQALAAYIKQNDFDTIHLHDHHVGLLPFYLGDAYLQQMPVHFTIHNATYQGTTPLRGNGYESLNRIGLSGWQLFHKYFDFFGSLNPMKACLLKVFENGGKITTVSGDLQGSWGYAAELKESNDVIIAKAWAQKGSPPMGVFVPNQHLDLFEKLPITGITNGLAEKNYPQNMPELNATYLNVLQEKQGSDSPLFQHPLTQQKMLAKNHNFGRNNLTNKSELRRLLHIEAFGTEPAFDPIIITAVGRLVDQKNLGLIVDVLERSLDYDPGIKFVILASAPDGNQNGNISEIQLANLANIYRDRVYFNNNYQRVLAKLILAGGDFTLMPSRYEPCGLIDYEASLLGTIVIGRETGGLLKVRHCAYLYKWLDIKDRTGEANIFFEQIKIAIDTYRRNRGQHEYMVQRAMLIDAGWDKPAQQYLDMYRFGLLTKRWYNGRQQLLKQFIDSLGDNQRMFRRFFRPGQQEYRDIFDWQLKNTLEDVAKQLGNHIEISKY